MLFHSHSYDSTTSNIFSATSLVNTSTPIFLIPTSTASLDASIKFNNLGSSHNVNELAAIYPL